MPSVADCFRQHAPAYLQQHGDRVPLGHLKVIHAINRCQSGELGYVNFQCESCGKEHWTGRSCGNRHCANCGSHKSSQWLEKQTARLLPTHYFLVTFTVPKQLRFVLRGSQRDGYAAIFDAGSEAIRTVASASKYLRGCQLGFFGVLHTWGRDVAVYHPHVHFVVPGGGVNEAEGVWQQTPENFFLPHAALSKVYKAKFADHLRASGLYDQVETSAWQPQWTVDIKPVGSGSASLKYLAAYVHRVGISDKRIVAIDSENVTYRYTPSGETRSRTKPVRGTEFIRAVVQHTLPSGFQKIRYYGWQSPNSRIDNEEVRWLVMLYLGLAFCLWAYTKSPQSAGPRCKDCGGNLRTISVIDHEGRVLYQNALGYLDSG